jgi:cytochrome c
MALSVVMTKKYRFLMVSILLGIILSILGCGDDFDTQNSSSSIKTGTFIDSPVEGLHYTTPTLSGFTNTKGEFQYKSGEMIRFSLGNLSLGEVQARKLITPLTLCGEYDLNNIGIKATNIARVLQTLGHNATSSTRLTIPTELRDLNISDINLELETDLNSLLVRAEALNGVNYVLVDSESAKNEMRNHIEEYNTIPGEVSTTTIESTTGESTVNLKVCVSCHGQNFEKSALGHSKIVKDMTKNQVSNALIGYKYGTYGGKMKGLMKGQVEKYSDNALRRTGIGK